MTEPNPKQQYGDRKVKLQLVPPAAAIAIANGLEEGAIKYNPWNWRDQPVEVMTYYGATLRHMAAWLEGEDLDPDSERGKTHLDGAIASLAILIDALAAGTAIDNRPGVRCKGALERLKRGSRRMAEVVETLGVECHEAVPAAITMPSCADEPPPPTEAEAAPSAHEPAESYPNWIAAPAWARYCAVDSNGAAYWFSHFPRKGQLGLTWEKNGDEEMGPQRAQQVNSEWARANWEHAVWFRAEEGNEWMALDVSDAADEPEPFPGPDWSQAPKWAEWWCFDEDGWAKWSQKEPRCYEDGRSWFASCPDNDGQDLIGCTHREYRAHWRQSLTRRPQ